MKVLLVTEEPAAEAAKLRKTSAANAVSNELMQRAREIMQDVSAHGDSALLDYTTKFDGVRLDTPKISKEEIKSAYQKVSKGQIRALKLMKARLEKSELAVLKKLGSTIKVNSEGVQIERIIQPIASVGCYIPGGKARYPSTVVMCAVPAKVARVNRIVAISPPTTKEGTVDPLTLVAADICGVDEFYKVGGAQGIAALAYGTESIKPVSKIVGPGGMFVTAAKIAASSVVSTDMVAGPTELLIYADPSTADPRLVAVDLISQAEHSPDTVCGLVTTSQEFGSKVQEYVDSIISSTSLPLILPIAPDKASTQDAIVTITEKTPSTSTLTANAIQGIARSDIVKKSISENGFVAICSNEKSCVAFANEFAPEHLEIIASDKKAEVFAKKIDAAGLILIGSNAPSSASDYCLGSNHVLPTSGFGKSRSSLSVLDYVKIVNKVRVTRKGLEKVDDAVREMAFAEGLPNHYEAVRARTSTSTNRTARRKTGRNDRNSRKMEGR